MTCDTRHPLTYQRVRRDEGEGEKRGGGGGFQLQVHVDCPAATHYGAKLGGSQLGVGVKVLGVKAHHRQPGPGGRLGMRGTTCREVYRHRLRMQQASRSAVIPRLGVDVRAADADGWRCTCALLRLGANVGGPDLHHRLDVAEPAVARGP